MRTGSCIEWAEYGPAARRIKRPPAGRTGALGPHEERSRLRRGSWRAGAGAPGKGLRHVELSRGNIMSDKKLRELERTFRESPSEEAGIAWLRERARAGEKLDWESYTRLHESDEETAADYCSLLAAAKPLTPERAELLRLLEARALATTPRVEGSPSDLASEFAARVATWALRRSEEEASQLALRTVERWLREGVVARRDLAWWVSPDENDPLWDRTQWTSHQVDRYGFDHEVVLAGHILLQLSPGDDKSHESLVTLLRGFLLLS